MNVRPAQRGMRIWQGLLALAAMDGAVQGDWALLRPADLFTLLRYPANDDGLLLCRALGLLLLANAVFLAAAAFRPAAYGGLTIAALSGRALLAGVWLWLLGSGRMPASGALLWRLFAHDAIWGALLTAFLVVRRAGGPSPAPAPPATPPAPPA